MRSLFFPFCTIDRQADISQMPAPKRSSYSNGLFESIENGPVAVNHACLLAPLGQSSCPSRLFCTPMKLAVGASSAKLDPCFSHFASRLAARWPREVVIMTNGQE